MPVEVIIYWQQELVRNIIPTKENDNICGNIFDII